MAGVQDLVVGVIGAGAMGSGIAQVAAAAGHRVVLGDAQESAVARARETMRRSLGRDVEKGRLDRAGADATLARISDAGGLGAGMERFAECGLVIEAVLGTWA
jgi:3-hydroxybutyryl-CoA dehydrogenase